MLTAAIKIHHMHVKKRLRLQFITTCYRQRGGDRNPSPSHCWAVAIRSQFIHAHSERYNSNPVLWVFWDNNLFLHFQSVASIQNPFPPCTGNLPLPSPNHHSLATTSSQLALLSVSDHWPAENFVTGYLC